LNYVPCVIEKHFVRGQPSAKHAFKINERAIKWRGDQSRRLGTVKVRAPPQKLIFY